MKFLAPAAGLLLLTGCAYFGGPAPEAPGQYAVFFANDSAKLDPAAQKTVDGLARIIKRKQPARVEITGQTDGTATKDMYLADQRAFVVMTALTNDGVPGWLLQRADSKPPGEGSPVISRKVLVRLE